MKDLTIFLSSQGVQQGEVIEYQKALELLDAFSKLVCPKIKKTGFTSWTLMDFKAEMSNFKSLYPHPTDPAKIHPMLLEFYEYWSEPNPSGKMRFQLEKTWETGRRIARWAKNNNNGVSNKPTPIQANGFQTTIKNR